MGQHHRREDGTVTHATVPVLAPAGRFVAPDAPPAGLGYPPPTAYRRDPVTGVPTPPRAMPNVAPAPRRRRTASRAPMAVAVAGAAMALVGMGSQIPGLVTAVSASAATAPAPAQGTPAVAGQCATVVADAIDETVVTLGRTPSGQWAGVVAAREGTLAATYGDSSPEQRAYTAGVDDVMDWLQTDPVAAESWDLVTTRVATTVATTCAG
ncbi:hypothetical protein EV188_111100 [Actinomycetospora succinea]|uniref:Uncharacterized protein n=1 Tax=Actinomycetospora succinea TaxID=663603 RepID=A0A4R6UP32_9PSEU|nr:hypothetical protein [Actinomycetospora succinea]TDQ48930.1 hypothetical protein EV188_111100 [Actinomycetospora succinea]